MTKNLSAKRFFLFALAFIVSADLAILLNIPILRQLFGVILLAIVPGILIVTLLKLNRLGTTEKAVLTIGLSTAFLMFFGWVWNQICLQFSYTTPLATSTLLLSLNGMLLILAIGAYIRNREAFSSFPHHFELNTRAKLCLLLPSIFPLLSITGARLLDTSDNNTILLIFLFLIPISVILIIFQRHRISRGTYPIAIAMISVALLSMCWLRSEHVLGHDVNMEYGLFYNTLVNQHWSLLGYSTLDSCLSISLLPAIYHSILNIDAKELLFGGVVTLIYSFAPLVVYIITRKYIAEHYAFLAALFFASQQSFFVGPDSPRTSLAIFFFALSIMVLFNDRITGVNRKGLFIIFIAATIVSHYSTSYIFFFLMLFTWLFGLILRKYTVPQNIAFGSVALLLVLIFLWYSQVTEVPFRSGVGYINSTISSLNRFFVEEMRSPEIHLVLGLDPERGIRGMFLDQLYFGITWATFVFIGAGIVGTMIRFREMINIPRWRNSSPAFLLSKLDAEYFLLAGICGGMLLAAVIVPYISVGYGMQRLYSQMMVVLSPFFVMGGIIISKYLRTKAHLVILVVLILYFLFRTGPVHEISGIHDYILLSSENPAYSYVYVHDQEPPGARWLGEHIPGKTPVYTMDGFGSWKLMSQAGIYPYSISYSYFGEFQKIDGYIYVSYHNVVNDQVITRGGIVAMSDYPELLVGKSKLYTNGGIEVYK